MLFKRKSADAASGPASASGADAGPRSVSGAPADVDRALDTVVAMLRRYGEEAFDTAQREGQRARAECDRWAGQILNGGDGDAKAGAPKRDFGGLRRFFDEDRRTEAAYVRSSLTNLRGAIHAFASALRTAVVDDGSADRAVTHELQSLAEALGANDSDRIREASTVLSDVVKFSIRSRAERQRVQVASLTEKLGDLRSELFATRERATIDALTKLNNRATFDDHVARISDIGLLLGAPPTLMMADVDHFKKVNDGFGHPTGDEVLRRVGEELVRHFLRKEDFVARYGGEEFAVVMMDASLEEARNTAERVRKSVRALLIEHGDDRIDITISIGLSSLIPGETAGAWVERADRALYDAKAKGRDRVAVADLPASFV
jgi:diguanylate cyclase